MPGDSNGRKFGAAGAGILLALEDSRVNSRLGKINSRFGGKKFPVMSLREFARNPLMEFSTSFRAERPPGC